MKKYTSDSLIAQGYELKNAKITDVSLTMADHGWLTLDITLSGDGWGVVYGGYTLGKGYVGAKEFTGYAAGLEAIMRIMDVVGVDDLMEAKGKYVRVALKGWGDSVTIIGNLIEDKWFDYCSFFDDKKAVFDDGKIEEKKINECDYCR